jgi:hypothetical protein
VVYNIEVHGDHTYYVAAAKLWVHNGCVPEGVKGNLRLFKGWLKSAARSAFSAGKAISAKALREIVDEARRLKLPIRGPELGSRGEKWRDVWHIHIGNEHVPCPPDFKP